MNKRPMILLLAGFMLASCGGQSSPASSSSSSEPPKEEKWNISKDDSSDLYAEIRGKALQISGRGFMKDFASVEEVPWKNAEIESIGFSDKTYSVGKNAFATLPVDYVILPDAMEKVGANAFNGETNVLAITRDTEFDLESDHIYFYTDEVPTVEDRYWQSDKVSGDIIPKDYVPTKADQWYYDEDDEPTIFAPLKVLFIGNSFTYRNGVLEYSGGIPGLFNGIAESLGKVIETYSITGPGWYLSNHAKATDTCGKQVDKLLHAVNDFDYIVLQEQSVNPFENYASFLSGVQALKAKIDETQTKAKTYLYETWGSPFSADERKITVPQMERKLDDAYTRAGQEANLPVSYIGRAFRDVYLNHREINLYGTDNRHQGFPGAYLSAATHVASMLGLDVREATYTGSKEWSEPTLSDEVYAVLRETAYRAGNKQIAPYEEGSDPAQSSSQDPVSEEEEKILRVACWGRFIDEGRFNKLMEAYRVYADANSVEYELIDPQYYVGKTSNDPYFYIANFTGRIVIDQPEIDIVLPCADNFNANQSNLAAVELIPIDVYGANDRRVARFNDDDLTMSFFAFAKTAEAAAIFAENPDAPQPSSSDEESSSSLEPVDESKTLRVACWGRFMKEAKFNKVIDAFKTYAENNSVTYEDIESRYYVGATNSDPYFYIADFSAKVAELQPAIDIVLPCADNFLTNQSNVSAVEVVAIEVYGQSNRRVARCNDDALTMAFYTFSQTAEAAAVFAEAD